ncbi:hypothetical protein JYB64_15150 [Algoriphagus aestuarii]|nr:hypothetical protein [Algoriphagus aestuarii]
MKQFLIFGLFFLCFSLTAQTRYRDEMGRSVSKDEFQNKILNGPYFGVPSEDPEVMRLIHRMPFGKVEPEIFYDKLGKTQDLKEGKSLIVVYYPGKDECNSTGDHANDTRYFQKSHDYLLKTAEKRNAAEPAYIFKNSHGLEKYQGIMTWLPDPDGIFEGQFFKFPYPCRSFVVIHPTGEYRAILGEFPNNQIDQALKTLNKN